MKKAMAFLFVIASLTLVWACSKNISGQQLAEGNWQELTAADGSLPVKRHEAAFIDVGDKFYLVGGRGMKPVSIYNPREDSWTQGAVPPVEIHHFQPVVYQDEIYVLGALTGGYPGETPVPDIYIYNPEEDNWRKGASIPADRRRGGAGAVLHGDKMYLVCGIKDGHRGDHKKWLDVYDLNTNTWSQLPDAPRPRDHFQVAIGQGKLYCLGGRTTISADNPFKNTIAEIDVFDLNTETWSTLEAPIPTQRAGNFVLPIGDEILVLGGESFTQEAAHAEVEALHIDKHTWRSLPPLPLGRHGTGAVLWNNKIYTASGCSQRGGNPELSDLWVYLF